MATLNTELNLPAPDDFYERLIATHRGLSDEDSVLLNAKLVLLLANHIGDPSCWQRQWRPRARDWQPIRRGRRMMRHKLMPAHCDGESSRTGQRFLLCAIGLSVIAPRRSARVRR
jgi:hypothetical protein